MEQACVLPFYDEGKCSRINCGTWAKFYLPEELPLEPLCGRHCSKRHKGRRELDKTHWEVFKESFRIPRREAIEAARDTNSAARQEGDVVVVGNKGLGGSNSVIMLSHPSYRGDFYREGFLAVFPNFKHGKTKEGFGCASLSPKAMGPIAHCMPNLPDATSIENYHQFSKVFPSDADADRNPTQAWLEQRRRGYLDPKPHRHSPSAGSATGNKNAPLYSVYYHPVSGEARRYSYLECRVFYAVWYERIAARLPEFKQLCELKAGGTNLQIVGYDAYSEGVVDPLWECFNDTSRPFGHELVLYTMLTVDSRLEYQWNRFRRENMKLYEGML